jgi:hypothetical protein
MKGSWSGKYVACFLPAASLNSYCTLKIEAV